MTRFRKLLFAAALGGTALAGTAYAAQDQAAPPPPPQAAMPHHRGHGDMFAKLDTNGDGRITQDEMKARHDAMRAKWQQRRGDQSADADAARQHRGPRGMHRHGPHHGGMEMKRLDANNDGIITKAEAEAAATARFDKVDTNHDGKIDQAEIAAAKQQMQARVAEMRAKWQARRAAQGNAAPAAQPTPTDQ
ncbi:MAG: hypothetical protein ACTHL5_12635 [Rhodanobacter sp.]